MTEIPMPQLLDPAQVESSAGPEAKQSGQLR
jgi:hypothetical protein